MNSKTMLASILLAGLALAGTAAAQAPAEKPAAPAEKPGGHDMKGMHGMMHAMHHPPMCMYEGRAYSRGALLAVRGVKPVLLCDTVAVEGHQGHGAGGAQGAVGGHGGHMPAALGWRVYSPAKAAPARQGHAHHKH